MDPPGGRCKRADRCARNSGHPATHSDYLIEDTQGLVPEHPINAIHRLDHRLILIGSLYFAAV